MNILQVFNEFGLELDMWVLELDMWVTLPDSIQAETPSMDYHLESYIHSSWNLFSEIIEKRSAWDELQAVPSYIERYSRGKERMNTSIVVAYETGKRDFQGMALSGAYLSHATLIGVDLSGANLIGANLIGVNLYSANLSHATLIGVDLYSANLSGANLSGANLSGANLIGANLDGANLRGVDLSGANLDGATLYSATLSGSNLSGSNLSGAYLRHANLSGVDLSGATLSRANLDDANLSGVDLSGAIGLVDTITWLEENFEKDDLGIIVYKTIGLQFPPPASWEIKPGSILSEVVNPCVTNSCGCGINVSTLSWVKQNSGFEVRTIWKCRIRWMWLSGVVVPYKTDGKIRSSRVELIEILD